MKPKPLYNVRHIHDFKDLLEQSASLYKDKAAFLIREEGGFGEITFGQLKSDVEALGAGLASLGLEGEFTSVLGENRYEWCLSYFAVTCHTGVVVPIDKELHVEEKRNLLERSSSKAIVFSGRYAKDIAEIRTAGCSVRYFINMDIDEDKDGFLSLKKIIEKGRQLIESKKFDPNGHIIDETALSILLFTSGTTDLAKGVMLSQKNVCSNIMSVSQTVRVDSKDFVLSILPLHHTYECTLGFLTLVYSGGTIAFNEGLKHIQKNFGEIKPTVLVTVPLLLENVYRKIWIKINKKPGLKHIVKILMGVSTILRYLGIEAGRVFFKSIHQSLGGRLRLIVTGAAAISPEVINGLNQFGIRVLQGYGLTECSPLVIGERDSFFGKASVGLPLPGVEVKIENQDENGVGEIVARGDNVMLGYYKNPEATSETLRGGWLHTGDLGKKTSSGAYFITGRLKNVIVTKNGKNIFPEEVETFLNRSPYVLESMVTGYEDKSGETFVKAHILPNIEAIKEMLKIRTPSVEDIKRVISDAVKTTNKDMPLYKRISTFTIRENDFIKTTTLKIKRYAENAQMNLKHQRES